MSTRPVPPVKPTSEAALGGREHLTEEEVEALIRAAGSVGRHRHRDSTMILVAYRRGFRVSELVGLRREHYDASRKTLMIRRLKGSKSGTHELSRREVTAINRLLRSSDGPFIFANERGGKLTPNAFYKVVQRAGVRAGLALPVHPHMLRHACGFHIINEGHSTRVAQEHLGHRNIRHTERYTELCPERLGRVWDD